MADEFGGPAGIKLFDISGAAPTLQGTIATPANTNMTGIYFAAESGNILATDFGSTSFDPRGFEYSPTGTLLREYRPLGINHAFDILSYPIPEPCSLALLGLGLAGLAIAGRRLRV